jgi:hypothetical protein
MTTFEHSDHRVCELRPDGTWTVRENPTNRGVVGLDCERHGDLWERGSLLAQRADWEREQMASK